MQVTINAVKVDILIGKANSSNANFALFEGHKTRIIEKNAKFSLFKTLVVSTEHSHVVKAMNLRNRKKKTIIPVLLLYTASVKNRIFLELKKLFD